MGDGDEKLTAKKAYELYKIEGRTQAQIAERFDVDQSYVSRLWRGHRDALEEGQDSVSPSDFDEDELRGALDLDDSLDDEDDETDNCGRCGAAVEYGQDCSNCGATLNWAGVER